MWFFVSLSQSTSFSFNQCKCFWRPMSAYLSRVKALFLWTNLGPILLDRHLGDGPVLLPRFHLKKGQRARGAAGLSKARRAGAWELNSPPIKGSNVSCQGRVGDNQRYPSGSPTPVQAHRRRGAVCGVAGCLTAAESLISSPAQKGYLARRDLSPWSSHPGQGGRTRRPCHAGSCPGTMEGRAGLAQEAGPQGASSSHWLWGGQASSGGRQLGVNNQPNIIILECFQPEEGPGSRGTFRGQRGKGAALSGGSVVVVAATGSKGRDSDEDGLRSHCFSPALCFS